MDCKLLFNVEINHHHTYRKKPLENENLKNFKRWSTKAGVDFSSLFKSLGAMESITYYFSLQIVKHWALTWNMNGTASVLCILTSFWVLLRGLHSRMPYPGYLKVIASLVSFKTSLGTKTSSAACLVLVKTLKHLKKVFPCFWMKNHRKTSLINKKGLNGKKVFWPAFGCVQHPKAGLKTQHLLHKTGSHKTYLKFFSNISHV